MKPIARILSAFTILALWGATAAFAATDQVVAGATVQLVTPNGGQVFETRTATAIAWTSTDVLEPATVAVLFSTDGGGSWTSLASGLPNNGGFSWGIPYALTGQGRIRVEITSADLSVASDDSDADFQVADTTPPNVIVLEPLGGENWVTGSPQHIRWKAGDASQSLGIDLEYSTDDGTTWHVVDLALSNLGGYDWSVPQTPSAHARVRVTAHDPSSNRTQETSGEFTILDPAPVLYTISASAGLGGAISPAGVVSVAEGGDQTFMVSADAGYHVADVFVDGASAGAITSYGFTNVTTDHTIAASFALDTHALTTAVVGAGVVLRDPDQAAYDHGAVVTLTAVPAPGNAFAGWSGDITGASNPVPVTLDADRAVTATFVPVLHTITASAGLGGTITPAGAVSVADDGTQAFTVAADAGYHVADVLVDGTSAGAITSYDFTHVTADHTIAAQFVLDDPTIAASAGPGGRIEPAGAVAVPFGTDALFTITPDSGFRAGDVIVDGLSLGAAAAHTFSHVVSDHSIHATFIADPPPSAAVAYPNDGGHFWVGNPITLHWTATDDAAVTGVDLLLSRTGVSGPYEALALGVPNSGSYSWIATGPATNDAYLAVVAHDAAANQTQDASDLAFALEVPEIHPMLSFRADSANGSGPYPAPGAGVPWVDLAIGHDASLWNFAGTPNSGWRGNGTPGNPYRLEFAGEEPGANTRVVLPSASVPELQTIGALTTSVWFKTGFNGPRAEYDYILEWVQKPTPDMNPEYEGRGMSIVIQNGILQVYANPWVDITPVTPNTWYHVVVVKDTSDLRVYVNGERLVSGIKSHRGIQESELVLGCSVFRQFENTPLPYADFFTGAVAQLSLSEGPMSDLMVQNLYDADRALYQPVGQESPPAIPLTSLVTLRAEFADGADAYASESAASPWVDLDAPGTNGTLIGFDGTAASGWTGDGSIGAPFALRFDGVNDCVSIAAGSIAELQNVSALTTEMWIQPDASILGSDFHYLIEWLGAHGASTGMSLAIQDGLLKIYLSNPGWTDLAPLTPDTGYHIAVVKAPGSVKVYVNGAEVYDGGWVNLGEQTTELVLGSSIWRGPGQYGDYFSGTMSLFRVWQGVLAPHLVQQSYVTELGKVQAVSSVTARGHGLALIGPRPNPVSRSLDVHFQLPTNQPATIELIDVAGRQVRARKVGAMGPGAHQVNLGHAAGLKAGVYFLRLTQGSHVVVSKATIVH